MTGSEISDHVAGKIREARKERGWNADELAARAGLTGNVIENIESGRRRDGKRTRDITVDELFAVAEALGVGPLKLLPRRRPVQSDLAQRDRERELRKAARELAEDRMRLDGLRANVAALHEEQRQLEDRITKSEWLIEQLDAQRDMWSTPSM
jgi:transcriptional regulator with XRE-family HTH domain